VHNFWSNYGSGLSGSFIGLKVVQHFAPLCFPPCQFSSNGRNLCRKGLANWQVRYIFQGAKNGDGGP
jgi:hypothetical protein